MPFLRPNQSDKKFTICSKIPGISTAGRVNTSKYKETGTLSGTLAKASQKEVDRWKQLGHPVTHQIISKETSIAVAGDYLQFNHRNFYIQGKEDPAELGHYTIYACEERNDVY